MLLHFINHFIIVKFRISKHRRQLWFAQTWVLNASLEFGPLLFYLVLGKKSDLRLLFLRLLNSEPPNMLILHRIIFKLCLKLFVLSDDLLELANELFAEVSQRHVGDLSFGRLKRRLLDGV